MKFLCFTATGECKIDPAIIDLTSNEEIEDIEDNIPTSVIKVKKPRKPRTKKDISVEAKTRPPKATKSRKSKPNILKDSDVPIEKPLQTNVTPSSASHEEPSGSPNASDSTQSLEMPENELIEQFDFVANQNQTVRYFRRYNGFRLFARLNHERAQELALQCETKPMVHVILLRWWSKLKPEIKEQYIQIADTQEENFSSMKSHIEFASNDITNEQTLQSIESYLNDGMIEVSVNQMNEEKTNLTENGLDPVNVGLEQPNNDTITQ